MLVFKQFVNITDGFFFFSPVQGIQVLNSRTLGKVSKPRLLLRAGLPPGVDPWLCSGTAGVAFDLP